MLEVDAIIVGGGPAGLSAAIYLARFNRSVVVIDHGEGRSTSSEVNENYLGFPEGIASTELRQLGRRQAERFGTGFIDAFVDSIQREGDGFVVNGVAPAARGRTLILATGVTDILPQFENEDARDYWGTSLYWCITCDGYKARGASVMVVGNDDSAATTCLQFLEFTDKLTFVSNQPEGRCAVSDEQRDALRAAGVDFYEGRLKRVDGTGGRMRAVELEDGRRIELEFLFNQQGAVPNSDLARALGVPIDESGYVTVDAEQRTSVRRVYAAGDLTKAYAHQVATAAHEGATAAISANYDLYSPEQREH